MIQVEIDQSKQWNKFDLWCLSLANLPKHEAQAFTNIHFVACSNRISAKKMSGPIVNDLCLLEKGVCMYDSFLETDVLAIAPVICLLCDNVRASELLNHQGSTAVKLCRLCMVSIHILLMYNFLLLDI